MSTIPDYIKKNVRAVLLSKVGGSLVSEFCKDYKSLLREQLNFRDLQYSNMNDFIKAMPDVVRLEFSDKDMAYRMFGIVDPSDSYTPLVAKKAAGSGGSPDGPDRKRNNRNFNCSSNGKYEDFLPNKRGHYTLCYPRFKEDDDVTKEDLEGKYNEFPGLFEVHMIPKMIFVRFTDKDGAVGCLEKYSSGLTIRIAEEKQPVRGPVQSNSRSEDAIISRKKSNDKDDKNEVYIGNLSSEVTQEDVEDMCREFDVKSCRCNKKKSDPRIVFAFVDFKTKEDAQRCIDKLDKLEHRGRNLNVRLANPDPASSQSSSSQNNASSAPSGGKISWRSGGGQTSSSGGIAALETNDESWDTGTNSNSNAQEKSSFGQSSGSSFGQSSGSSFGQSSGSGSTFGQSSGSTFGQSSGSTFGQSSGSTFGQSSGSTFGQSSGSSFGQSSGSLFGKSTEPSVTTEQKTSSFGQNSSTFGKGSKANTEDGDQATVYFGNLHISTTEESLTELVQEYSPIEIRLKKNKDDPRKVFGFVVVSSEAVATEVVNVFNQKDWNGRKINCRVSQNSGGQKQNNARSPPEEKVSFRSSASSKQNGGLESQNNNDESWDSKNKTKCEADLSKQFNSLSVETGSNGGHHSMLSPLGHPSPRKTSPKPNTQKTFQSSPHKGGHYNQPQSSPQKVPKQPDFSDMPPLEPATFDEMPPLEPAVVEYMPTLDPSNNMARVWVANFPYFETEDDMMYCFGPLGAVDVNMVNQSNLQKTTGAVLFFEDEETAEYAIQQSHQSMYKGRLLCVQMYEPDPDKRTTDIAINLNISVTKGTNGARSVSINPNSQSCKSGQKNQPRMNGAESCESLSSNHSSGGIISKSFRTLLHTYKIIMNKLGVRVRDVIFKPYSEIQIFVTSVYDDGSFWGQIADDEILANLEETLEMLQSDESKIGFARGLGRCAAWVDDLWFRGWVVAELKNYMIEVFNVDYGNTDVINKNNAAATLPQIWDLPPTVRPFRIQDGSPKMNKDMEQSVITVQVTGTNVDDTGFLTEVKVTGQPE